MEIETNLSIFEKLFSKEVYLDFKDYVAKQIESPSTSKMVAIIPDKNTTGELIEVVLFKKWGVEGLGFMTKDHEYIKGVTPFQHQIYFSPHSSLCVDELFINTVFIGRKKLPKGLSNNVKKAKIIIFQK